MEIGTAVLDMVIVSLVDVLRDFFFDGPFFLSHTRSMVSLSIVRHDSALRTRARGQAGAVLPSLYPGQLPELADRVTSCT